MKALRPFDKLKAGNAQGKAFTLIELLVVVVIIGIIATMVTIAISSTRMKARDAKRVADIKQMQAALELYYAENLTYPASWTVGQPLVSNGKTFMAKFPTNPSPRNDGTCVDSDYGYLGTGTQYAINFCLGGNTAYLDAGDHYIVQSGYGNGIIVALVDAPVSGIDYTLSTGQTGTTDGNGFLTCYKGATVTFKLGNLVIGTKSCDSLMADRNIFLPEILGLARSNTAGAQELSSLLWSLDTDGDAVSSTIQIDSTRKALVTNAASISAAYTTLAAAIPNEINQATAKTRLDAVYTAIGASSPLGSGGGAVVAPVDATAPSAVTLAVGSATPVASVTNVAIPAAGATDTTGAVTGWVAGTANKIKFTVTDSGSAVSTITIGGSAYTSGTDYAVPSTASLTIIITTTESGKTTVSRTFTVSVAAYVVPCATNSLGETCGGGVLICKPNDGNCGTSDPYYVVVEAEDIANNTWSATTCSGTRSGYADWTLPRVVATSRWNGGSMTNNNDMCQLLKWSNKCGNTNTSWQCYSNGLGICPPVAKVTNLNSFNYWSYTDYTDSHAYVAMTSNGSVGSTGKYNSNSVRCVRRFN